MQNKTKQINIRVTEDEKKALEFKANSKGYTKVSEFILTSIIKPERLNLKKVQGLCYELNKIGVNLNQISRRANQEKGQLKEDILQQLAMLDEHINEILEVAKR